MRALITVLVVTVVCMVMSRSPLAPRWEDSFSGGRSGRSSGRRSGIPRIIVQTHRYQRLQDVPSPLYEMMTKLRDTHPGWEYRYYNHDEQREFIKRHMPTRVLSAYDALNPAYSAARADLFRYVAIYVNGGVYLDCKSGLQAGRTLNQVATERRLVMAHWPCWAPNARKVGLALGEYVNWFVAAPPSDPMLRAVIDRVVENIEREQELPLSARAVGKPAVLHITGPIVFTQTALAVHTVLYGDSPPTRMVSDYGLLYEVDGLHPDKMQTWHYARQTSPVVLG